MTEFSYYFIWATGFLSLLATGINFGRVGKPREPITIGTSVFSLVNSILFLIACFWMVRP